MTDRESPEAGDRGIAAESATQVQQHNSRAIPSERSRAQRRHDLIADVVVVLFLLALCLTFFWQLLIPEDSPNRRWLAAGDFTDQFYAFRHFQADELWSGRLPLWNPHTFSGSPFLADIQSAVFYPIGLLIILLFGKGGLPLFAVELEVIVHFFLASLFVFFLVKRLTGSRLAGLASGIIYAYGSYLTSYPKLQMAILEGQVWVPLALLAVHVAAEKEKQGKRRRASIWLALGGAALGLTALAGHGQTFLLAGYTVMAYLVFAFFPSWWASDRRRKVSLIGQVLILPLVALGLAAVQLMPSIEYTMLSARTQLSLNKAGGGFMYSDLLALILPGLRVIYVGILPLVLAILALVLKRKRETTFWGITALLALLLSLGRRGALYTLFYIFVPGFDMFQGQERALQVFCLAMAILAGYGLAFLDGPMAHDVKRRYARFCKVLVGATVGALALALLAYWGEVNFSSPESGEVNGLLERSVLLLILLGLSTMVLRWRLGHKLRGWKLGILVVPIIVLDLFTLNYGHDLQRAKARDRFEVTPLVRYLQEQPAPFRVWDDLLLPGNFGNVWGLEQTWGISPLFLKRYEDFVHVLPEERARQLLNVHYVTTWKEELHDGQAIDEYSDPGEGFYLHRVTEPGLANWFTYSAEVMPDDGMARQRLADPEFDPQQAVILADEPPVALPGTGSGTVRIVERQPDRLALEVDSDSDGILVLSEIYYPGWQATVDGQKTSILRANTILRALPIEAGSHSVEMVFRPASVYAGLALSLLVLVAVVTGILWNQKRDR